MKPMMSRNPSYRCGCFPVGSGLLLAVLVILLPFCLSAAPTVVLDEAQDQYPLGLYLDILEDQSQQLTFEDITHPEWANRFVPSTRQTPIPGYVYSDYWVRFTVENPLPRAFEGYLEYRNSHMARIDFYQRDETGTVAFKPSGLNVPIDRKDIRSRYHLFQVSLPPSSRTEFFMRFDADGPVVIPLTLWTAKALIEKTDLTQTLLGMFYGLMGVMLLYHLFLFISLRERSYLYYILFIGCTIWYHLARADGLGYQYLWPDNDWLVHRSGLLAWMLSIGMYVLFSLSFLNTRKVLPRLHLLISVIMVLVYLNGVFSLFGDTILGYRIGMVLQLSGTLVLAVMGGWLVRQRYRPAAYYLVAMLFILIGATAILLRNAGFLPDSTLVEYAVHIAVSIQAVILALGLADRIKVIQRERAEAQEEALENRRIAIENLKKADQLKDEFLAGTSHELKTPLHGIIGLSESLIGGISGPLTPKMAGDLKLIVASARRLSGLVGDLMDFSRLKHDDLKLAPKPVNLHLLVNIVLTLEEAVSARKQLSFRNRVPQDFPAVWADENRLQQVLTNLVGNAAKFTAEGSVSVCARVDAGVAVISIKDTGSGIDPAHLDEIFEPFRQLDSPATGGRSGIGLGLAITRKLIEQSGGKIEVDSSLGLGSEFRFMLPLSDEAAALSDDRVGTVPELPVVGMLPAINESNDVVPPKAMKTGDRCLLLVEDDPVNRQVVTHYLSGTDYRLISAENGAEGLEIIKNGLLPDLILLDIMMPVMNGFDFCREFRQQFTPSAVPIIFLTARSQAVDLVQGFALGANDYITKPFSREELLIRIDNQMRQLDGIKRVSALRNLVLQGLQISEPKVLMQEIMQMLFDQLRLCWIGLTQDGKLLAEQRMAGCEIEAAPIRPVLWDSEANGVSSPDLKIFNYLDIADGNAVTGDLTPTHEPAGYHAICLRLSEIDEYQLVAYRQPEQAPFSDLDAEYVRLMLQAVSGSRKSIQSLMNQRDLIEAIYRIQLNLTYVLLIRSKSPFCEIMYEGNRQASEIIRITMQTLDLFFPNDLLVRVHRSCIVNADRVLSIQKRNSHGFEINLKTTTGGIVKQPVGRMYLPRLRKNHPQWFVN
jgi:two-component system, sensor histidine kinase LadS